MRRLAPVICLLAVIPFATALAPPGEYLDGLTRVKYAYDPNTNTTTEVGLSAFADVCTYTRPSGSPIDLVVQCGECVYVPDGPYAWQSPLTHYTTGRCASIDIQTVAAPIIRIDARMITQAGEDWHWRIWTNYYGTGGFLGSDPNPRVGECEDFPVSHCSRSPSALPVFDAAPVGTAYYCLHTQIFNTTGFNSLNRTASLCSM